MKVLLTGASGFVGRHVNKALTEAGHSVVAVSRRHGIDMARMGSPATWQPLLDGVDAVINAVGIIGETQGQTFQSLHTISPTALFQACANVGVRRVVQISALGADSTAFSSYHLTKRAADDGLRRLPLDWFVLRPSLIYGPGGTSASLLLRMAALPMIPIVGDGRQLIQPVHIGDVVNVVMQCLTASPTRLTLDIVGPETLSLAEWLQRLRAAQGLPPARVLPVHPTLVLGLAALGRALSPMLRPENVRMLLASYTADGRALEQFLRHAPRAATPDLLRTMAQPPGSRA
jgi:uncharacterized protein YbjT (DUF2867 family)